MPIKYILDNENNFVLYEISGVVNPEDLTAMSQEFMGKIEQNRSYNEFYLFTETTAYWAASKEYYERMRDDIVQRDKKHGYKRNRTALVTFDQYGKMVVPLWKAVTDENEDYIGETEIFECIQTASDWLGIKLDNVEKNITQLGKERAY